MASSSSLSGAVASFVAVRRGGSSGQSSSSSSSSSSPSFSLISRRTTRKKKKGRATATAAAAASTPGASAEKVVWVETTNVQVLLSALEIGLTTTALFNRTNQALAEKWNSVGRFTPLHVDDAGVIHSDADAGGSAAIGVLCAVDCPEDVADIARLAGVEPLVVMDSSAWQVIPAENLVAAYGASQESRLMAVATTARDAEAMFEALETGTDGVVLRTDDPAETQHLAAYLKKRGLMGGLGGGTGGDDANTRLELSAVTVTRVETVGVGDRVCVDCSSAFSPGEGLLVGSFAQGLFLVHAECLEAQGYVNSRPFRVNAGAICSYCLLPGGKTAYLSELRAGDDVMCVGRGGETHVKTVGRVKVEQRQMVLVEAEEDAEDAANNKKVVFSALLQNAETVRLMSDSSPINNEMDEREHIAVSVSVLQPGDRVLLHRQTGARHTGLKINEANWYER